MTTLPKTAFVVLHQVNKVYPDGTQVLAQIDLEVRKDEFISLIGPSGCGKSSLLKILTGLVSITSGSLSIDGMKPQNARTILSYVFQDPTLLPWRNVRDNIGLALEVEKLTKPERRARIDSALNLVALENQARLYPRQLSGGMKMRVSIARALVTSPRLLLMDEPFGALDEISRNHLNEELLRLKARQRWTAIFVTHSVPEAVFLSDRIIVMRAKPGRIHREIKIPLPQPRTEKLRRETDYLDLVREVSAALKETYL